MGAQVAELYQELADQIVNHGLIDYLNTRNETIKIYKEQGRQSEIQARLNELKKEYDKNKNVIPYELAYLMASIETNICTT